MIRPIIKQGLKFSLNLRLPLTQRLCNFFFNLLQFSIHNYWIITAKVWSPLSFSHMSVSNRTDCHSEGPDWIPTTVVERLGSLSFLVETKDHQLWIRHIDHIKDSENIHQVKALMTIFGNLFTQELYNPKLNQTIISDTGTMDWGGPETFSSTPELEPSTVTKQYLTRHHTTPDYYRPETWLVLILFSKCRGM